MTPDMDAAALAAAEEAHRAFYGFCLGPCEHETCREERRTGDTTETGESGT